MYLQHSLDYKSICATAQYSSYIDMQYNSNSKNACVFEKIEKNVHQRSSSSSFLGMVHAFLYFLRHFVGSVIPMVTGHWCRSSFCLHVTFIGQALPLQQDMCPKAHPHLLSIHAAISPPSLLHGTNYVFI